MAKNSGPRVKPMTMPKASKSPTMKGITGMALPPGTGSMMPNPLTPKKGKKGKM